MNGMQNQQTTMLREELAKLLTTLKHNREKISLDVLNTKYKRGYDNLCADIRRSASDYAKKVALCGIRIHKDYLDEAFSIVNGTIAGAGILKQLSNAAFSHQDITEFESLAGILRQKILTDLEPLYTKHLGLYITQECLENPDIPPMIYCRVNHCIWQDGKWIPLELMPSAQQKEKSV